MMIGCFGTSKFPKFAANTWNLPENSGLQLWAEFVTGLNVDPASIQRHDKVLNF
jgi:hypothetical protein